MRKGRFSNKEIVEEYDKFAKFYDLFEFPFEIFWLARLRRELLGNLRGDVLEIAVGSGRNLKYYNKECKITAIDLSKEMLELAKNKAKKLDVKVDFRIGDSQKLNFGHRKFDYVVDSLGMCTFSNPIKALKEMKRVCKKNGKIILLEHGMSSNRFFSKMQYWREKKHYDGFRCSLIRNHEELVKKAGLKIESIEKRFFGIFYAIIAI